MTDLIDEVEDAPLGDDILDHGQRRALTDARRKEWGQMTFEEQAALPANVRPEPFRNDRVKYVDTDVLSAARERIRHVIDTFDRVAILYSGGKDSHVVLHLTRMIMDEMGIKRPLDVVFQDEELIPDDVINHVLELREQPERFTLHYVAVPLRGGFFCLGQNIPYTQWDENREWMRPKPEGAITNLHPENKPMSQQETQQYLNQRLGWRGRIAMLNGLRASESLRRFRSCQLVRNTNNYIMKDANSANTWLVKPIYDWSTYDIFRFFYDHNITYCKIYDTEMHAGTSDAGLRVSTPLHAQSHSYLCRLRVMYPTFFSQICDIFPGVAAHERYWRDFDRFGVIDKYPKSFAGILKYIDDHIDDPASKARAVKVTKTCYISKSNNKKSGKYSDPTSGACYGYPLLHVFQCIVRGTFTDGNINVHSNPDARMIAYERAAEEEAKAGVA